ncbi:hypothetical protein K491DRAFT_103184 [Lophiostoma macrostomum CBS 122681]|uniref:Zn(2)-C6 fungal-type domain-containing protein n=1 Tax=Lophiostoma macrostomum CBS 122681 TaxID=1314788 RepID=A0A6A6STZ0_9PLEO|nr:hypothetical protein K491DRAFT_103184 [Lophiostoma macrostomum CBS 122681]
MASSVQVSGHRRKVTVACLACRQRRAKCSGTEPCGFCSKHMITCTFDYEHTKRRGPRPRLRHPPGRTGSTSVQPLAPRASIVPDPALSNDPLSAPVTPGGNASNPVQLPQSYSDPPIAAEIESEQDSHLETTQQNPSIHVLANSDCDTEGTDVHPISTWCDDLTCLFERHQNVTTGMATNLAAHLIELFWQSASHSLDLLLDHHSFYQDLKGDRANLSLCLALCACSSRLSRHPAVAVRGKDAPSFTESCEQRARSAMNFRHDNVAIGDIQAICVLAEVMSGLGYGAQAWLDLGTARRLTQLIRLEHNKTRYHCPELERVNLYLHQAEVFHAIGNPTLRWHLPQSASAPKGSSVRQLFHELLDIYIQLQTTCVISCTDTQPPAWKPTSAFKNWQEKLDEYPMKRPIDLDFQSPNDSEENIILRTSCVLIWHCCVMLLNRPFLFVPSSSSPAHGVNSQIPSYISFPCAPELFVKERNSVCEASAVAVCVLCQDFVDRGHLLKNGPLLGYALLQAALVLLNQLRCKKPSERTHILDHLKVAFTIMGALRTIFVPAHAWIRLLFCVHDNDNWKNTAECSSQEIFATFFGRFVHIEDASLVTLWPPKPSIRQEGTVTGPEAVAGTTVIPEYDRSRQTIQRDTSWIQRYTAYLDEDIAGEEESGLAEMPPEDSVGHLLPAPGQNDAIPMEPKELWDGEAFSDFLDPIGIEDFSTFVHSGDQLWDDFSASLDMEFMNATF